MEARRYLYKVIRLRRKLIAIGASKLNTALCLMLISDLERWLKFYPAASEAQVRNFLRRHYDEVLFLLPGGENRAGRALMNQLDQLITYEREK